MRITSSRRFLGLSALLAAEMVLTAGPCAKTEPDCAAEPLPHLVVFVEGPDVPTVSEFSGVVTGITESGTEGFDRIIVREPSGSEKRVKIRLPRELLPLVTGRSYDFRVEYVGGYPGASGLAAWDTAGLVVAGGTDSRLGSHVLKDGIEDFAIHLATGDCSSREESNCYEAIVNLRLEVSRNGRTVSLWNGQSGELDGYRVTCLTAQKVDYSSECADAGLPEVSWMVTRADSAEASRTGR